MQKTSTPGGSVQSVNRALDLLEAFPVYGPEIGLSNIASILNMNKATAYRLLTTLEQRGYIDRSPDNRKYRLGAELLHLGAYFQRNLDIRRIALPHLYQIAAATGEAAFLCVRDGPEALCIERVAGIHDVNIFALRVGGRQPLHCGAAPRALLASLSESELQEYADQTGLPGLTEHTLTSLDELRQDVAFTQKQGYVLSNEDVTLGIAALGAPLYDHAGHIAAAISLSGLAKRFTPEHIDELAKTIRETADTISERLGYQKG